MCSSDDLDVQLGRPSHRRRCDVYDDDEDPRRHLNVRYVLSDDDEDEDDRMLRELHEKLCSAEQNYMECTTAARRLKKKLDRVGMAAVEARLRLLRLRKDFQRLNNGSDVDSADVDVNDELPTDDEAEKGYDPDE